MLQTLEYAYAFQQYGHLQKGGGEQKTYHCQLCPASYKRSCHLRRHEKLHIGQRYPCPFCGKSYTRNDKLKTHIDNYHKKQPHTCDWSSFVETLAL